MWNKALSVGGGGGMKMVIDTVTNTSTSQNITISDMTNIRAVAAYLSNNRSYIVMSYYDDTDTLNICPLYLDGNCKVSAINGNTFTLNWNATGNTFKYVVFGE